MTDTPIKETYTAAVRSIGEDKIDLWYGLSGEAIDWLFQNDWTWEEIVQALGEPHSSWHSTAPVFVFLRGSI